MQKTIRQSAFIIALSSAALVASAIPAHAQNAPATPAAATSATSPAQAQWLNIGQVHEKLVSAGYTDIREIERERGGYEAKALDKEGRQVKLYIDPRSGDVINQRTRDKRNDD
ncbi:PepSY domain-containing protein [Pusillimonas minor]|uniref:PepSY domain-containing protein n=1 Tax=Pusillimonas minor TaxID=2697024 RepID=A0A842HM04_9BURK|nr:PepSY domain-containing protein [Pusillimonas minor]MBC2768944.1 PepSY domain-containing protein [Pusillimonas minor]